MDAFSRFYAETVRQALSEGRPEREAWWTEAVAVGSEDFVDNAVRTCAYRVAMDKRAVSMSDRSALWIAREPSGAYSAASRQKNGV